jgi:hypothetical protein
VKIKNIKRIICRRRRSNELKYAKYNILCKATREMMWHKWMDRKEDKGPGD